MRCWSLVPTFLQRTAELFLDKLLLEELLLMEPLPDLGYDVR